MWIQSRTEVLRKSSSGRSDFSFESQRFTWPSHCTNTLSLSSYFLYRSITMQRNFMNPHCPTASQTNSLIQAWFLDCSCFHLPLTVSLSSLSCSPPFFILETSQPNNTHTLVYFHLLYSLSSQFKSQVNSLSANRS